MFSYFKISALLPFCIAVVTGIILSLTHDGSDYKSEWSTDDGFGLTVFLTILVSASIVLLSLSIFFNQLPAIKNKKWLGLICWFAPACAWCAPFIYQELMNVTGHNNFNGHYEGSRLLDAYILTVTLTHPVCLWIGWLRYRRAVDDSLS